MTSILAEWRRALYAAVGAGDFESASSVDARFIQAALDWTLPVEARAAVAARLGLAPDSAAHPPFRVGERGPVMTPFDWIQVVCRWYMLSRLLPPNITLAADEAGVAPSDEAFRPMVDRMAESRFRQGPRGRPQDLLMDRFVHCLAALWESIHGEPPRRSFDWRPQVNREAGPFREILTILLAEIDSERPVPQFAYRLHKTLKQH